MKKQKLTPLIFNPENKWVQTPRWHKRIQGFVSYIVMAFCALWEPEATDWVLYNDLKDQFLVEPADGKPAAGNESN